MQNKALNVVHLVISQQRSTVNLCSFAQRQPVNHHMLPFHMSGMDYCNTLTPIQLSFTMSLSLSGWKH